MESVILGSPELTLCLGACWVMQVIFRKLWRKTSLMQLIPAGLCALCLGRAVILGAALREIATVLCLFFLLSLMSVGREKA